MSEVPEEPRLRYEEAQLLELCGKNVREHLAGTGRYVLAVLANRIARRVSGDGIRLERWTIPTTRRILTRSAGLKQEAVDWDMMPPGRDAERDGACKSPDNGLWSILESIVPEMQPS